MNRDRNLCFLTNLGLLLYYRCFTNWLRARSARACVIVPSNGQLGLKVVIMGGIIFNKPWGDIGQIWHYLKLIVISFIISTLLFVALPCSVARAQPQADLSLTKVADNVTPAEGATITYTVTVTNSGPDDATSIRITDALPAGVSYASDNASQGTYDLSTGLWDVGDIANLAIATLQIEVRVDGGTGGTTITNTAEVAAVAQGDPDSTPNNQDPAEDDQDAVDITVELLRWTPVDTPGSIPDVTKELWNGMGNAGAEINKLLVCNDGRTLYVLSGGPASLTSNTGYPILWKSTDGGVTWSADPTEKLMLQIGAGWANYLPIWDMAIAPDAPDTIAVVLDKDSAGVNGPLEVWISTDGGASWADTQFPALTVNTNGVISCIDISPDYGGKRDVVVGLRNGAGTAPSEMLFVQAIPSPPAWADNPLPDNCDVIAVKFSPAYISDQGIVAVTSGAAGTATWMTVGFHDTVANTTDWASFGRVEVRDPTSGGNSSPDATTIITADLELPGDYSAGAGSLRRAYISTDAGNVTAEEDGIFRIDDNMVYELMDTSAVIDKRISSIAYWGTYATGKLLAGEVTGWPCTATVPTWFTDSPTVCPIPCWCPAKKLPTGAANQGTCTPGSRDGYGNAQVAWSLVFDGVAYVATGSAALGTFSAPDGAGTGEWPDGYLNRVYLDESALSITRNNGDTYNQLSLIDTKIDKLTDVAASADSATVYLATVNQSDNCGGFDSVWRSSSNGAVVSPPLPAAYIGAIWERVWCHVTDNVCTGTQSDYAILRLAPDKTDGQILFWAAKGATPDGTHGVVAWSPDYGDCWADITPNLVVQDMAAESSTQLYVLDDAGLVQMMPYTGTAWSSANPNVDTSLGSGFSIAALAGGHVLVGAGASSTYPAAYSDNSAVSFTRIDQSLGSSNFQVAFDTDFATNGVVYVAAENVTAPRGIYRNTVPGYSQWTDLKSLDLGYHGLAVSSRGALYAANLLFVERTLYPETGVPGELGEWDVLKYGLSGFPIRLTLPPNSLKVSGGLTPGQNTTLWAIDDSPYLSPTTSDGKLWKYEDSFAKAGPAASGDLSAQCSKTYVYVCPQVNIPWGQLGGGCFYEIQQADNVAFTQVVWTYRWYEPPSLTSPEFVVPVGGTADTWVNAASWLNTLPGEVSAILGVSPNMDAIGLETTISVSPLHFHCGYQYYYRIRGIGSTGEDVIRSPWSATWVVTIGYPRGTGGFSPGLVLTVNLLGSVFSSPVLGNGRTATTITATSPDGNLTIPIPSGTSVLDKDDNPLICYSGGVSQCGLQVTIDENPPPLPEKANIIGLPYKFEPSGVTFDPPITIEFTYNPADIPEGVAEEDLVLAYYDEEAGKWVEFPCTVDPATYTITASVNHFTTFAIIAPPAPPAPAAFSVSNLSIQPTEVQPNEAVTITLSVGNTGGTEGSYSAVIKINGVKEVEKSVTIAAGSSQSVSFSITKEETGSYSVTVDGLSGSFTVATPAAEAPAEAKPPISWTLIWIIIAAVVIVGLIIFFAVRQRV